VGEAEDGHGGGLAGQLAWVGAAGGGLQEAGDLGVAGRGVVGVEAAGEEPLGGVGIERDDRLGSVVRHLSGEHVVAVHRVTPGPGPGGPW
jgi:hypothetical protein